MSKTEELIGWLRPFHDAAEGRTSEALDCAMQAAGDAPEAVRRFAMREGFRLGLHALHRSASIRVNGDAESMPLFVAVEDEAGVVTHRMRSLVTVAEIRTQVDRWGQRRDQASRELAWWSHQRELAEQASAEPDERLVDVWDRLGVRYEIVTAAESA